MESWDSPPPSQSAVRIIDLLRLRDGKATTVWLRNGRSIAVMNIAWGQDAGDPEYHITSNISPTPTEPHSTDFFSTADVQRIVDPASSITLFEHSTTSVQVPNS
jgi:hypothetical protein